MKATEETQQSLFDYVKLDHILDRAKGCIRKAPFPFELTEPLAYLRVLPKAYEHSALEHRGRPNDRTTSAVRQLRVDDGRRAQTVVRTAACWLGC